MGKKKIELRGTENSSAASLVSMRDAVRRLVQIDAPKGFEEIKEPVVRTLVDLFFEGRLYICYDPINSHLGLVPTSRLEAEMQYSDKSTTFKKEFN